MLVRIISNSQGIYISSFSADLQTQQPTTYRWEIQTVPGGRWSASHGIVTCCDLRGLNNMCCWLFWEGNKSSVSITNCNLHQCIDILNKGSPSVYYINSWQSRLKTQKEHDSIVLWLNYAMLALKWKVRKMRLRQLHLTKRLARVYGWLQSNSFLPLTLAPMTPGTTPCD